MSKATTPRNHHYIPQGYLKGFTNNGHKKSKLVVFDLLKRKIFSTIPRNVCANRDFNRLDIPTIDPNLVEKGLSHFEGLAANALINVSETKKFKGKDKEIILNLIALLETRSPQRRANWVDFESQVFKMFANVTMSSKDNWERMMGGHESDLGITYEQALELHKITDYGVDVPTERHIGLECAGIETILPLLRQRNWLLVSTPDSRMPFITTDNPVILSYRNPDQVPPHLRFSPGHKSLETTLQFPISKTTMLLGEFDGIEDSVTISDRGVSILNSKAAFYSNRQIYSPSSEFSLLDANGKVMSSSRIFSLLRPGSNKDS